MIVGGKGGAEVKAGRMSGTGVERRTKRDGGRGAGRRRNGAIMRAEDKWRGRREREGGSRGAARQRE